MKKFTLLFAGWLFVMFVYAQPQEFSYQAVVRSSAGAPVINQLVALRFSVLELTATGTVQYSETQQVTTNAFGLVNVQIGAGTIISGSFAGITWSTGTKFLKVEADITGGTNYTTLGINELTSVPFALNAPGGTIMSLSSAGSTITMTTTVSGSPSTGALLSTFGSTSGIPLTGSSITLSGANSTYPFVMPRAGIITGLAGFFTLNSTIPIPNFVSITAQLYQASVGSNTFNIVNGATVNLSTLGFSAPFGSLSWGLASGLSIAVPAQTRLLWVYSFSVLGGNSPISLSGYANGSINFQ